MVLFVGDAVLVCVALYLAALLRFGSQINVYQFHPAATLLFSVVFLNSFYVFDLYNLAIFANRVRLLSRLTIAGAVASLLCSALFYFLPRYRYGRGVFVLAALLAVLLSYAWRRWNDHYWAVTVGAVPTLVIGTGSSAAAIRSLLHNNSSSCQLVGFVRTKAAEETAIPCEQIVSDTSALEQIISAHGVGWVVVACEASDLSAPEAELLTRSKLKGIRIDDAPGFYASVAEALPVELLRHSWLWFAEGFDSVPARMTRRIKRASDLLLANALLALSLPITICTALAIKLDSAGPVFYRQKRVGKDERVFELLKFRSMYTDAESRRGPLWAEENDERVTRVGRFVRKLHIDEIPQVINVLKGDMSFIGPRPERMELAELYKQQMTPFYHLRHYVQPGITGWAQVNYPYGAGVEDAKRKLEYDLYYILHASLLLDLRIVMRTIRRLIFPQGSR